jgi:hypothetical protein
VLVFAASYFVKKTFHKLRENCYQADQRMRGLKRFLFRAVPITKQVLTVHVIVVASLTQLKRATSAFSF